jgi:hypothetical protein
MLSQLLICYFDDIQKDFSQYNLAKLANIAKYSYERYRLEAGGDKKILENYVMIKGNTHVQYLVILYNLLEC